MVGWMDGWTDGWTDGGHGSDATVGVAYFLPNVFKLSVSSRNNFTRFRTNAYKCWSDGANECLFK